MASGTMRLTAGHILARSVIWNLAGLGAPLLVALIAIPALIDGMGNDRFGLLAIIWMGVGYFSLFDLGLGRALTKIVSERLALNECDSCDLGSVVWTAFILLFCLSALGAIILYLLCPLLVTQLLKVPVELHREGITAFRILAIGLPFVILTSAVIGLLEAHQRFGIIASVRIPLGILTFTSPLITLHFTPSTVWATSALLICRLAALIAFYVAASNLRPELYNPQPLDRSQIRPLLSFGGWLTVSNIIGPFMIYFDRFLVGSTLGLSAVTFYVTPYEIISKFQIFPNAVMSVFFPAMAATHVGEQDRLVLLYKYSEKMVYWVMLPITLGAFLLAPEGLFIWLGEDFRINATSVTRWLAAGCMVNMMARPAFTALQASGHPDLVAKAHLTELGFYIVLLWWLTVRHGIVGTAAAWTLRVFADTLLLSIFTARQLPTLLPRVKTTLFLLLLTSFLFWVASLITTPYIKLCLLTIVISISWVGLWPFVRCAMSRNSSPIDKHA